MDIAVDDLPASDCAILRPVLQHLSNAEVAKIVQKLYDFKYAILTAHIPIGDFVPSKDIISGQGIRLKKHSGLLLLAPPFNVIVKEEKQLSMIVAESSRGAIVTSLYQLF